MLVAACQALMQIIPQVPHPLDTLQPSRSQRCITGILHPAPLPTLSTEPAHREPWARCFDTRLQSSPARMRSIHPPSMLIWPCTHAGAAATTRHARSYATAPGKACSASARQTRRARVPANHDRAAPLSSTGLRSPSVHRGHNAAVHTIPDCTRPASPHAGGWVWAGWPRAASPHRLGLQPQPSQPAALACAHV